jgi:hypothetical protein
VAVIFVPVRVTDEPEPYAKTPLAPVPVVATVPPLRVMSPPFSARTPALRP